MTIVVDASAVVAGLLNKDPAGAWAEGLLVNNVLVAPHHMPAEAAQAIRRLVLAGELPEPEAARVITDLLALQVTFLAYGQVGNRVWDLRHTVTVSDAWYVALAEDLDCELATLDGNLVRAPGPRCRFLTPPPV